MKVFSIFGYTKSGKTTTAEYVIAELRRRGYSVGSVKDIHFEQFTIETEGSNTDRHKKAGAQLVTARGLKETDILLQERLPLHKLLDVYECLYAFDYVVLEGENEFCGPGIVCGKNLEEADRKWDGAQIDVFALSGVASVGLQTHRGVPAIDATTDAERLADLIETHAVSWESLRERQKEADRTAVIHFD